MRMLKDTLHPRSRFRHAAAQSMAVHGHFLTGHTTRAAAKMCPSPCIIPTSCPPFPSAHRVPDINPRALANAHHTHRVPPAPFPRCNA